MTEEKKSNSEGIWIPEDLLQCKKFTIFEKNFLVAINYLDNNEGCTAGNQHFSERFILTKMRCSQIINSLVQKNMIKMKLERKGERSTKRTLNILDMNLSKSLKDRDNNHKGLKEILDALELNENLTAKGIRGLKKPLESDTNKDNFSDTNKDNFTTNKDNYEYNKQYNKQYNNNNGASKKDAQEKTSPKGLLGIEDKEYHFPKKYNHPLTIIQSMMDLGLSCQLPKKGIEPSKTLIKALDHIHTIYTGMFSRKLNFDKEWINRWIKKWPEVKGYVSWKPVQNLIEESLERMVSEREANIKLGNGDKGYPKSPEIFFFNPMSGKSMFLKFMNNKPKTTINIITDFQISGLKISETNMESIKEVIDERDLSPQQSQRFWIGMRKLKTWHEDNIEDVIERTKKRGSFPISKIEKINSFFFWGVIPYLKKLDENKKFFSYDPIPVENEYNEQWRKFCGFVYKNDGIKLDCGDYDK